MNQNDYEMKLLHEIYREQWEKARNSSKPKKRKKKKEKSS